MKGVKVSVVSLRHKSAKNRVCVLRVYPFEMNHYLRFLPERDEKRVKHLSSSRWNVVLQCFALSESAAAVFTQEFQFFSLLSRISALLYCTGAHNRFCDGRLERN